MQRLILRDLAQRVGAGFEAGLLCGALPDDVHIIKVLGLVILAQTQELGNQR